MLLPATQSSCWQVRRISLSIDAAGQLQRDELTIFIDPGVGELGVSGGTFEDESIDLPFSVAAGSGELRIRVVEEGVFHFEHPYAWPDDIASLFAVGEECADTDLVNVEIGSGVLAGATGSITVTSPGNPCLAP